MASKVPSKSTSITTVKISQNTKRRLENLRLYKRETYDEIIERFLDTLNLCRFSPEKARSRLMLLEKERRRNLGISQDIQTQDPQKIKNALRKESEQNLRRFNDSYSHSHSNGGIDF
jgi:hypothetical protein